MPVHLPKLNQCCIASGRKQEILASTETQIKQFMCFKQEETISTLSGRPLRSVVKFTYIGSNISSTECDINRRQAKAWTTADKLLNHMKIWSAIKIKLHFFQAVAVYKLLYGRTTKTLTKRIQGKINRNYTSWLNKSWKQHVTKKSSYTATYLLSRQTIQDKQDRLRTAEEIRINS